MTNKLRSRCLVLVLTFSPSACSDLGDHSKTRGVPPDNHELVTITQGIWGNVWLYEGDFMPSPDGGQGSITPVVRELWIFTPTLMSETTPVGGTRFTTIHSTLITTVSSKANGFYQIALPESRYSIFVKEDSMYYANWFEGEGYISQVRVAPDSITKFQVDLTYNAVF